MWKDKFPKENRYFETENGILYNGDCLEIMKEFSENSVDLVLTDPPYGIGKAEWDYIDFKNLLLEIKNFFIKILKENRLSFIWIPKKEIYNLKNIGFNFDIFIETKNFAQKRKTDIGIDCWVPILMLRKRKYEKAKNREGFKNWFMINSANTANNKNNPRKINHPTVKDIEICKYIIEKTTKQNEIIFDAFLGSGTTAVACEKLNRKWIGIELSEEYCELAKNRILSVPQYKNKKMLNNFYN